MPGATPLSELLSDQLLAPSGWGPNARVQDCSVAFVLRVYLQEAGTCALRLACVCECVSVCVRSGGWPVSLSSLW